MLPRKPLHSLRVTQVPYHFTPSWPGSTGAASCPTTPAGPPSHRGTAVGRRTKVSLTRMCSALWGGNQLLAGRHRLLAGRNRLFCPFDVLLA